MFMVVTRESCVSYDTLGQAYAAVKREQIPSAIVRYRDREKIAKPNGDWRKDCQYWIAALWHGRHQENFLVVKAA
jgi:hypothetical protein